MLKTSELDVVDAAFVTTCFRSDELNERVDSQRVNVLCQHRSVGAADFET